MPFLHDRSKTKHKNSNKTVRPTSKSGFLAVSSKQNELYEGNWINNKREGFGSFVQKVENNEYIPNYKGNWLVNKRHGLGNAYIGNGYYVGEWVSNRRNGYGKMWYADGSFYAGDWKCNLREGDGLFVQVNGNRYEGKWHEDKKHGVGRFYYLDTGQMQEGTWQNDIAISSTIQDIPFRQSAIFATSYPIPTIRPEVIRALCKKNVTFNGSRDTKCYSRIEHICTAYKI